MQVMQMQNVGTANEWMIYQFMTTLIFIKQLSLLLAVRMYRLINFQENEYEYGELLILAPTSILNMAFSPLRFHKTPCNFCGATGFIMGIYVSN